MRNVRANEQKVTACIPRNILSDMADTLNGLHVDQFIFGMIMPEKIILQSRSKIFEGLFRIKGNELFLNFQVQYFLQMYNSAKKMKEYVNREQKMVIGG